ncbi:hypothetical protein, partial [Bowmanella denitrificans]|uniref:hypothetical protein n=1 Tax=Bowmanella denitrificans TaxID=366582 RepID=UPI0011AF04EA
MKKLLAIVSLSLFGAISQAQTTYEVDAFAALPAIQQASVSPDGKRLAVLRATSKNGDYIIEVRNVSSLNT